MNKTKKVVIIISVVLGVLYLSLLPAAASGYGYMGYNGYHSGASFWYWGGPSTYYERDIRSGSVSGSGVRGGGPGAGK
ncbi:hypothetical protein F0266_10530 [Vibrio coralliilyticus]|jgi:hypothetical protein|uniref:hypothetical protein n=1 Tax=Vibrio TaxID=662 RepID=UPI0005061E70|nr:MULTISPECIES: hypothetical protein [Vibrio]KFI12948.1 hypothetical protein IX95_03090 [Vibrio sp. B183]NOH53369.1 hypothetical protein [Vibrio coralliilyticus]NOI17847.1 hypothetical protein [Vibrio coralliilyticus]